MMYSDGDVLSQITSSQACIWYTTNNFWARPQVLTELVERVQCKMDKGNNVACVHLINKKTLM
ncbi:MAG: hypothetical protein AAGF89_01230 [Bacteroidota bacterium]